MLSVTIVVGKERDEVTPHDNNSNRIDFVDTFRILIIARVADALVGTVVARDNHGRQGQDQDEGGYDHRPGVV